MLLRERNYKVACYGTKRDGGRAEFLWWLASRLQQLKVQTVNDRVRPKLLVTGGTGGQE